MANQEGVGFLTGMEREFSDMRSAIVNLQTDHRELKYSTINLQSDTHKLKPNTQELKSLTAKLQTDTQELESLTASLQSDNRELKSWSEEWKTFKRHIRYSATETRRLGAHGGIRDDEFAVKRNDMAHGGDIINDLEVIQHPIGPKPDPEQSDAYKAGIEETYGITFEKALEVTPTAPKQLIETFNIRASVTELYPWGSLIKQEIQELADDIIAIALAEPAEMRNDLFAATDGRLAKRYENLVSKYEYRTGFSSSSSPYPPLIPSC